MARVNRSGLGRAAVVLALGAASLVACGGTADDQATTSSVDPSGREWVLEELGGEAVSGDTPVTLLVDEGQLSGSSGCNRYVGAVDLGDRTITFDSEIAQTRMACPDEVMALEQAYLAALATVVDWTATEDNLTLLDADGNEVAVFA